MMEHGFRMNMAAELFRIIQLELSDHVYELVHLVRIGVEVHHGVLDLTEIVALLEDAGSEVSGHELLFPVDLFSCLYEWLPLFGVVNDVGDLNIVSPVFDVLNDYLVRGVDREAGSVTRLRCVQSEKAQEPILVTPSRTITSVMLSRLSYHGAGCSRA